MVRRAVGAAQPSPVHREDDRQVLEGDFLEDVVEAALQEGAVDVDDGPHARFGHASCEGDGVPFADAGVEEAGGKLGADGLELVALAHRSGENADARVGPHLGEDGIADGVGVGAAGAFLEKDDAGVVVATERSGRVELHRIGLSRLEPVPLLGEHVQEDRALDLLDHQ